MEPEILEKFERGDLDPGEPRFDDERTILAAQPVVSLAFVTQSRNRRRWLLIGAFVIASMLGSATALALIRLQDSRVSDVSSNAATTEQTEQPVAQAPTAEPEPELFDESFAVEESDTSPVVRPVRRSRQKHQSIRPTAPQVRISIKRNGEDDPEPRLVDQWQERRQRSVRRQPQNHHQSDLFRIREIFEGQRRPRRR